MTSARVWLALPLLALALACGSGGGTGFEVAQPAANVMTISVNGSLCTSSAYQNEPCVQVTVCSPGTGACQAIDGILLDTGSTGLRVFRQALTVALEPVGSGSGLLAECVQYADGTSNWGPVETAGVVLGGEPAVEVPIQVIDSTFGILPSGCANADASPAAAGFNGVLGVGIFAQDCGPQCAASPETGWYYACESASGACAPAVAGLAAQVTNPVLLLPQDNNGVIVELPAVAASGASSATGSLVLGIGTRSNNQVQAGVARYPVDGYGDFVTVLAGQSYPAFLDSGSNGFFFPPPASPDLPTCSCPTGTPPSQCANYTSWFCPTSATNLTVMNTGAAGSPSAPVVFQIANFDTLLNGPNSVFANIGGPVLPSDGFDWGLPFYFGRDVYFGLEGKTSSLGTGPYFAY